jgi:hypothetical protein
MENFHDQEHYHHSQTITQPDNCRFGPKTVANS